MIKSLSAFSLYPPTPPCLSSSSTILSFCCCYFSFSSSSSYLFSHYRIILLSSFFLIYITFHHHLFFLSFFFCGLVWFTNLLLILISKALFLKLLWGNVLYIWSVYTLQGSQSTNDFWTISGYRRKHFNSEQ